MSSKTDKTRVKIPKDAIAFAKISYKKFKKAEKDAYSSEKKLKKAYYLTLLDYLPEAINFVIRSGYIQTEEVQQVKGKIYEKICDKKFVKILTEVIEDGDEIENIKLLPILIAEILRTADYQNKLLKESRPDAETYDVSDLAELSELILRKKIKKLSKAGVPKKLAFDVLSIIPCKESLTTSRYFRIRSFFDVLYEHAKEEAIPYKEIVKVLIPDDVIPRFITFALLERKEKFAKLDDKQKTLYLDISSWCFDTMEKDLKSDIVRGIIDQYIAVRRKDDANGKDSNRRYALSSLVPSEYKRITDIVQSIIVQDPSTKKYL